LPSVTKSLSKFKIYTGPTGVGQSATALGSGLQLKKSNLHIFLFSMSNNMTVYKQRRAELNDLKAEYGILSRTLEILMAHEGALSDSLDRIL
jgi:hypothetical protein